MDISKDGFLSLDKNNEVIENGVLIIPKLIDGLYVEEVFIDPYDYDVDRNRIKRFESVSIPSSVQAITVYESDGIYEYIVDEDNQYLSSYEGSLYNKEKTKLFYYGQKSKGKPFPETLTSINNAILTDEYNYKDIPVKPEYEYNDDNTITNYLKIKIN